MPIYVYRCTKCDTIVQKLRTYANIDVPVPCPDCEDEMCRRMISASDSIFKKRWIPTKDGWIDGSE